MTPDFVPLFRNPHLATIAGNFWQRSLDARTPPAVRREYRVNSKTTIVSLEHQPCAPAHGQLLCLHGLEGSADAGYLRSLTNTALSLNFGVHRLNLRTCGGTEELCQTMYHSGLTSDTEFILGEVSKRTSGPVFLVGFSLGGNVAVKLTGELGGDPRLAGTVAISAPLDLAACVKAIDKPLNFFYARRFLDRLKARIRRKSQLSPGLYSAEFVDTVSSIWQFDNRFTAPLFGFGNAANYYATESGINYVDRIRTPTVLIAAQDDPLVPFSIFHHPSIRANPSVEVLAPRHGGHIGFLSRRLPRFWVDTAAMAWIQTKTYVPASV